MSNQPSVRVIANSQPVLSDADAMKAQKIPMSFDAWWTLTSTRLKLKPMLKPALKKHLQVKGFLAREAYDEGLAHFGIKAPAAKAASNVRAKA
jgi:hypothetical protein